MIEEIRFYDKNVIHENCNRIFSDAGVFKPIFLFFEEESAAAAANFLVVAVKYPCTLPLSPKKLHLQKVFGH